MKIIYYITDMTPTSDTMIQMVRNMMFAISSSLECHLMTSRRLTADDEIDLRDNHGIHVHYVKRLHGNNPFAKIIVRKSIRNVLNDLEPDVIHVHGTWDRTAALVEKTARKLDIATIVSTHDKYTKNEINTDFWKKKLIPLLTYQLRMVRQCTCILAFSEKEQQEIMSLSMKKRIKILNDASNTEETAATLTALYRKASDSKYLAHLTDEERAFVEEMVRTAAVEHNDFAPTEFNLESMSPRRISFYAYDEDVTELMYEGMMKRRIIVNGLIDAAEQPRFPNKDAKVRITLADMPDTPKKIRIPANEKEETKAITMIYRASRVKLDRLTLRQMVELYHILRHVDFNEDIVAQELKHLGLKKFTKKLQPRLMNMFDHQLFGYFIFDK